MQAILVGRIGQSLAAFFSGRGQTVTLVSTERRETELVMPLLRWNALATWHSLESIGREFQATELEL